MMEYMKDAFWMLLIVVAFSLGIILKPYEKPRFPNTVIVYDRSNKVIVRYDATARIVNGELEICDATVMDVKDVSMKIE